MTDSQRWMTFAAAGAAALLIYLLGPVLAPFLVGALLAYLGDPVADRLEAAGLNRTGAVTVVFAGLTLVLVALVLLLVPLVHGQIVYLQDRLPEILAWLRDTALPWASQQLDLEPGTIDADALMAVVAENWARSGDIAGTVLGRLSSSGMALAGWLATLALIPVVTFYLLRDWDVLVARLRDLLPRGVEPTVTELVRECDEVLGGFLRGQLLVMLALGLIYAAGLWLIGLDLALLIGLMAGLLSIVPYLGTVLGVGAALVAGLFQFQDWLPLIGVLAVFGIGQFLEGTFLTPMLVGDRIGMHPVAVIFAVLAGGQLFGFAGMLLALPVAAIIMVGLRHAHDLYKDSDLYHQTQPDDAGGAEED